MDQRAQPRLLALGGAARRFVEFLERPWQTAWLLYRHDDARHALYYPESQSHAAADAAAIDLHINLNRFFSSACLVDCPFIWTIPQANNLVYLISRNYDGDPVDE